MRTARAASGVSRRSDEADAPRSEDGAGLLALDVLAVLLFAAVGRRTHAEGLSTTGIIGTAWPFLAGTATGWAAARAWRRPSSGATGLAVWVATVAVGMLLRRLTGEGTAWPFVMVATGVLAALLLGWRAVAHVVPAVRREGRP